MASRKRAAITQTSSKEDGTEWQETKLPICILMNILSLLPIRSLFTCRCVCKVWLNLISDPYFAKLHLERSPISILIKTTPPKRQSRKLHLTQIEQDHATPFGITRIKFTAKTNLPTSDFHVVNSCNGLLCLSGSKEKDTTIYICNPILGEYITISLPNKIDRYGTSFGLGFSAKTNEYKVIQTFPPKSGQVEGCDMAEVYTIGSGEWRSLGNVPYRIANDLRFNSFLNGALHWIRYKYKCLDYIHSFDFGNEMFQSLPPPSQCDEAVEIGYTNPFVLGVLDGCLSLSDSFADPDQFDIWVMKEYGVKESWTKLYVIETVYLTDSHFEFYEPIIVLKSGEILMLYDDEFVVSYNMETKHLRETRISRTQGEFHAIAYTPCFVSLRSIAKGEELKSSRIQGTEKKRKVLS